MRCAHPEEGIESSHRLAFTRVPVSVSAPDGAFKTGPVASETDTKTGTEADPATPLASP